MNQSSYLSFTENGGPISRISQASIGLIGIISNILAICVFERKELKKHSYSIYWKAKALIECLFLLHAFRNWAKHSLDTDFDTIWPVLCRFNKFAAYVTFGVSLWLEFVITLDRFFTIIHPNKFRFIRKRSFQVASILALFVLNILVYSFLPFNHHIEDFVDVERNVTLRKCVASNSVVKSIWILSLTNTFIVNVVVNPVFDVIIISRIISTRRQIRRLKTWTINDRKFAISAIGINISSLLLRFPFFVISLLSKFLVFKREHTELIFLFSVSLSFIDKSDVLVINLLVNSIFRREFFSMLGFYGCKRRKVNESSSFLRTTSSTTQTVELIPRAPLCLN